MKNYIVPESVMQKVLKALSETNTNDYGAEEYDEELITEAHTLLSVIAGNPVRPGSILRLNKKSNLYAETTLFICVAVVGIQYKIRSHYGTAEPGPALIWNDIEKFDVIGWDGDAV